MDETPGIKLWIDSYHRMVSQLLAVEVFHDGMESTIFEAADSELCELIEAAPAAEVDALRSLRVQLHHLHDRWRIRRAALVGSDPELLAGALGAA